MEDKRAQYKVGDYVIKDPNKGGKWEYYDEAIWIVTSIKDKRVRMDMVGITSNFTGTEQQKEEVLNFGTHTTDKTDMKLYPGKEIEKWKAERLKTALDKVFEE